MRVSQWLVALGAACATLFGCGAPPAPPALPKVPEVVVSVPVVRQVTDYEDFTGRVEAKASVEVRARVTGYLERVLFKEGTEVKEGAPLFEIDPRSYQAELKRAEANVMQSQARLRRCERDLKRASDLLPQNAISQDDFDQISSDREEAAAAVKLAEASRDLAQLNLSFTRVTSPITGRISRQLIDPGNMVKADETALTTIVSMEPIYAYFDEDERTLLRVRRLVRAGVLKTLQEASVPVLLGLVDEEGFPHEGRIDFADNRVDAMTGTLRLRGVFSNPQRMLSPGLFVRIRLPIGVPHPAILVSEQALGTDQGQSFLYVVNGKNEVVTRRVNVGLLDGGLRVIEQGLDKGERVIVSGLQRVRAGVKVAPKLLEPPGQASGPGPQPPKPNSTSGTGRS